MLPARIGTTAWVLALSLGVPAAALAQGAARVTHNVSARVPAFASVQVAQSSTNAVAAPDSMVATTVVLRANAPSALEVRFPREARPLAVRVSGGEWIPVQPDGWTTLATRPAGKHAVVVEIRTTGNAASAPTWRAVTR